MSESRNLCVHRDNCKDSDPMGDCERIDGHRCNKFKIDESIGSPPQREQGAVDLGLKADNVPHLVCLAKTIIRRHKTGGDIGPPIKTMEKLLATPTQSE